MITIALLLSSTAQATDVNSFVRHASKAWATAPMHYYTAYSPCLDGLIVNFRSAGCSVSAEDPERLGKGSVGLVCTAPVVDNAYSRNEYVIFHTMTHDVASFPGWNIFCVDPNITMYLPDQSPDGPAK